MTPKSTMENFKERILILGDGNFSFSLSFAKHKLGLKKTLGDTDQSETSNLTIPARNCCLGRKGDCENTDVDNRKSSVILFATSFDSKEVVCKDAKTKDNINSLNELDNVFVLHDVDATNLNDSFDKTVTFTKVIFNFPHVGGKSNIRACRLLLERTFKSIMDFIDRDSEVLITLCKGQGGTPIDASRNGYGNSWKVVTQAAKAGFILSKIASFQSIAPPDYETAGYRGRLTNGFIKEDAITHIFKKGGKISLSTSEYLHRVSRDSLISFVDNYYMGELRLFNPFEILWHPFAYCSILLRKMFSKEEAACENVSVLHCRQCRKPSDFLLDGKCIKKCINDANGEYNILDAVMRVMSNSKVHSVCRIFADSTAEITPFSYPIYQEVVFFDATQRFLSIQEHIVNIEKSFQDTFDKHCDIILQRNSNKINRNSFGFCMNNKETKYDASKVPNFLNDIQMDSWLNFNPDVTISQEANNLSFGSKLEGGFCASLQYKNVNFKDYILSQRERNYFSCNKKEKSFCSILDSNSPIFDIFVNDMCIGKSGVLNIPGANARSDLCETSPVYVTVFRTDLVSLAMLQTDDIRLFWVKDESYLTGLSNCLLDAEKNHHLPSPRLLYPLCYRHDLCFWVNECESEALLLAAVRHCCSDAVHSVRLLRILRHEESNLLSFCYRIIYSRCAGPLSHNETVELQNRLRLFLIDIKFDLR